MVNNPTYKTDNHIRNPSPTMRQGHRCGCAILVSDIPTLSLKDFKLYGIPAVRLSAFPMKVNPGTRLMY